VSLLVPRSADSERTTSISPCEVAAKASMDCLEKNDYKRPQCLRFFEAYKECKKTWVCPPFRGPWSPLIRSVPARPEEGRQEGRKRRLSRIKDSFTKFHNTVTLRAFPGYSQRQTRFTLNDPPSTCGMIQVRNPSRPKPYRLVSSSL